MRCISPIRLKNPAGKAGFLDVPCGYCGSCRHNRRIDWSFRLKVEFKSSLSAKFLTLTYSDENIVKSSKGYPTLVKKDFQKFFKRLRKRESGNCKSNLRYYCVGEYGSRTCRPHYHLVLFNSVLKDDDYVNIWKLGHVDIGQVNDASIHYITKYHVNYDKKKSEYLGIEPEFAVMSRKPGIGYQYVSRGTSDWNMNNGYLFINNNGYKQRMPRYFREKIFDKATLELLGEEMVAQSESRVSKEIERLSNLGYDDPYDELYRRTVASAEKVFDKGAKSDIL